MFQKGVLTFSDAIEEPFLSELFREQILKGSYNTISPF